MIFLTLFYFGLAMIFRLQFFWVRKMTIYNFRKYLAFMNASFKSISVVSFFSQQRKI